MRARNVGISITVHLIITKTVLGENVQQVVDKVEKAYLKLIKSKVSMIKQIQSCKHAFLNIGWVSPTYIHLLIPLNTYAFYIVSVFFTLRHYVCKFVTAPSESSLSYY